MQVLQMESPGLSLHCRGNCQLPFFFWWAKQGFALLCGGTVLCNVLTSLLAYVVCPFAVHAFKKIVVWSGCIKDICVLRAPFKIWILPSIVERGY